ncbi:uncharacterized protein LOC131956111 [Physella acuta]|uniref:uncharacterized protein LOC131956111 n=1 Tax=Physella acuta TaxID=109671 RepID=UPI0027DB8949|nr:uncharacterized protein LOC131956111 [Physella acuta]
MGNVPKQRHTFCKSKKCKKHTIHKVTQNKAGKHTQDVQGCDKVFSSHTLQEKKGVFHSPGYPSHYPLNVSCKYKFIGRSNERVSVQFSKFALQGRPPT